MKLHLGELDFNGMTVGKETRTENLIENPAFRASLDDAGSIDIFNAARIPVDGCAFKVKIVCWDKKIRRIQLTPLDVGMADPGYPSEAFQAAKKKVCDEFLRTHLGEPSAENESVLYYEFEWGNISSRIILNGRSEYMGGFIEVNYERQRG